MEDKIQKLVEGIKKHHAAFGGELKSQFAELDKLMNQSILSPEDRAKISQNNQKFLDAIANLDESKIMEALKEFNLNNDGEK